MAGHIIQHRKKPTRRDECGTQAGYKQHLRSGENTCQPCRAGHAAANRDRAKAKDRAKRALATRHRAEYLELLRAELQRLGIEVEKKA